MVNSFLRNPVLFYLFDETNNWECSFQMAYCRPRGRPTERGSLVEGPKEFVIGGRDVRWRRPFQGSFAGRLMGAPWVLFPVFLSV